MSDKLKVNVKPIGLLNLLAFKKLVPNRKKRIDKASDEQIVKTPPMNALAQSMHPDVQTFKITGIKKCPNDVTIYELKSKHAAYFRAGQYLSVKFDIGGYKVTRPYTILSSPKDALKGKCALGIKTNGFVSEHIAKTWKVGDTITTSGPEGTFYYDDIRDAGTVVGIAGGCGIMPFYSMAQAIMQTTEKFKLVLLYGSRSKKDIVLRGELDDMAEKSCGRIEVVHVLSEQEDKGCETGFVTKELIQKHGGDEPYSIFMCGPQEMYDFVGKEIAELGLAKKYVRAELYGQINNIETYDAFPSAEEGRKYKMTIIAGGKSFETLALTTQSVLVGIERAKVAAPSKCRTGECGYCRSRLVSGDVFIPEDTDGRRAADKIHGYIHPCASFPISDIVIEIPKV
jgi:ferredoxin-NADP reductase